jgi:hypothetical protein
MPFVIAIILALIYFGYMPGCEGWTSRYAAEVGYYKGDEIAYELWGDYESLDDCKNAAIARYNYYFSDNKRAYAWSCLLKDGKGGYTSRHR